MSNLRTPLNLFFGRFRFWLAKSRKRILEVSALSPGHWKWAACAILMVMGLLMAGMAIDFIGELHAGIFLAALVFFPGVALLAGLGVRLGIGLLSFLPPKHSWIFFGAVFFVLSFFGFPKKAQLLILLCLVLSGSFLGAGIYNMVRHRWLSLSRLSKGLTVFFTVVGAGLLVGGWVYLLFPGKTPEPVKAWSMEAAHLPPQIGIGDPSGPGPYQIDSLTYGWGKDKPRKDFGSLAALHTDAVDGSSFVGGWEKFSGKMRTRFWQMGPDSLALNGRVWYPMGEGPFPLVLMVHGNHLDRDFSDPGYDYLGRHFASHGIIAVSVDENFLNSAWSDFKKGLDTENDCRGWLLLKHLEQWRTWNQCDTLPFYEKVDLERVVLIGHSRGGEAVSIASCFNRLPCYPDNAREAFDFHFNIRGIAAIAPVDGQYYPAGIPTPLEDVNYFTIQGSMDADLRSYDGLRQMRRVQFSNTGYHFAAGLYLHGANHGQFNRSWGIFDNGYPNSLLLNRKAIIPVEQQEQVALVYLTAFVLESCYPDSGYLPLFKDYRTGRQWLPQLVHLNQFHESTARVICDFEEDLDLGTGTRGVDSITASGLALWKEGRIPKKWGDYRNNAVFLGWNNEQDSVPGVYTVFIDSSFAGELGESLSLTFLAADAQMDPGEREKEPDEASGNAETDPGNTTEDQGNAEEDRGNVKKPRGDRAQDQENAEKDRGNVKEPRGDKAQDQGNAEEPDTDSNDSEDGEDPGDADPVPVDFTLVLTDSSGVEYRVRMGDFQKLQPAIKPPVFKSRLFWEDAESEVIQQYVDLPLEAFQSSTGQAVSAGAIRSISFVFDAEKNGTVLIDQLGFSR